MTDSIHLLNDAPFGRVLPAMVTPMKPSGDIDYDAAVKLAQHLVADGADGLVLNGTTGESPATHLDEKMQLVRLVKEAVNVPVISGSGSNDTMHTVRMSQMMQEAGADALLVVAPYYSRPEQQGIYEHYKSVNDNTDLPIIVYDVPGRTGVRISDDTYLRLAELDHVTAVKDATGDLHAALRRKIATQLTWYSGDDGIFLPFLAIGAVGIISVIAHVASGSLQELAQAFDRGDIAQAREIAVRLDPLVSAMNGDGFQAVMAKAAAKIQGYIPDTSMRLPNVGPTQEQIDKVMQGMRESGIIQ